MIGEAIKKINPNAVFTVRGEDIDTCEIEWLENTTPILKEDIKAKIAEMPTAEEEQTAKETAQASGNQKLLDLGLTQAEATALTGYTPPTEV